MVMGDAADLATYRKWMEDELHPELAAALDPEPEDDITPRFIRHRFVHTLYSPINGYWNLLLEQKREAFGRAAARDDLRLMLMLLERPYRLGQAVEWLRLRGIAADGERGGGNRGALARGRAAELLIAGWIDCEFPSRCGAGRGDLIRAFRAIGYWTDAFDDKPPSMPIEVFRGAGVREARDGMSWTMDFSRAEWFANRWRTDGDPPGWVWRASVEPGGVLAILTAGNESEVVLDPARLTGIEERSLAGPSAGGRAG